MATLGELKRRKAAAEFEKEHGSQEKELPIPEIATGVVVLIILLVFGAPKIMNSWNDHWVGEEVNDLVVNISMARNTAMDTKHNVIVTFEPDKGRYSLHEDNNANGQQDSGERVEDRVLGKYIQFSTNPSFAIQDVWGQPLKPAPVQFIGGDKQVTFKPDGSSTHNGAVYVVPVKDIEQTTDRMKAIQVLKTVGEITVLRYKGDPQAPWGVPIIAPEPVKEEGENKSLREDPNPN